MNFIEAEARFSQLKSQVQRCEPLSRTEIEKELEELVVHDHNDVTWRIDAHTGKWLYFDGATWVRGTPPPTTMLAEPSTSPESLSTDLSLPPAYTFVASRPSRISPNTELRRRPTQVPSSSLPTDVPVRTRFETPSALLEEQDLARNQWIPLASTSLFFLLSAVCVIVGGNLALRFTEPQPTPIATTVTFLLASPILPTATLMPSPTPVPPTPAPVLARVVPGNVNVRAAPSITARIIGQIKKGSQVSLIARSEDGGWFLVVIPGGVSTGWVLGELLEMIGGDLKTLPTSSPGTTPVPHVVAGILVPTGP